MQLVSSLLIGLLFGLGIVISGMINPAKVLNFFDVAGSWDPSLMFVMGGALLTTMIGYRLLFTNRTAPVLAPKFELPANRAIDSTLVGGAALFGIGWGIAGFCPGGAIPALGLGDMRTFAFVASMIVGILTARVLRKQFSL